MNYNGGKIKTDKKYNGKIMGENIQRKKKHNRIKI